MLQNSELRSHFLPLLLADCSALRRSPAESFGIRKRKPDQLELQSALDVPASYAQNRSQSRYTWPVRL